MPMKAAKFAALFARLRSAFPLMALLALFAALPRTASAATFPARSGGMPDDEITEDSPTVPYYTDGSTKYAFTTWVNLLRAVGWNADSNVLEPGVSAAGGTAGDPLKVTLHNFTGRPSALGCKSSRNEYWLYENSYHFGHTIFEFNHCHFSGGISDANYNRWGTQRSGYQGLKIRFVDCEFGDTDGGVNDSANLCISLYTDWDYCVGNYIFDYTFDDCTIHKFQGAVMRLFGGRECGHLLVTNCYLDVYVNAIVQSNGVASDGQQPTFTVADCVISDRITSHPGWMVGVQNAGFQNYSVSGLKYSDDATVAANRGQPLDVVFYKSFGEGVEDDASRGKVLNSMGGESASGRAEFSCEYVPTAGEDYYLFEYLVPVHVTYSLNRGRGTLPAREGYDMRNTTVCAASGSGLTRNGGAFTEWNTAANGSGATVAAGALIAGGGQLGGDVTLYAQYGAAVPQYSVDGGVTWNDYPTEEGKWQAVIDAYREHCKSGASATTELVGGTSEKQGTIYVRNIVFDSRDQLSVGHRTWGSKYYICLYTDYLKYTTIRFDNCTFDKMDASYGLFGPGAIGQQLVFVDCDFYEDANTSKYAGPFIRSEQVYPDGATYCYPVDLAFTNCCGGTLSKGGAGIGDLSIVDCSFAVNVNGHIAEGALTCSAVNSFGLPSTCHIENLQPPPGADFKGETGDDNKLYSSWTCSFAKYELSGSEGYVTTAYRSWWHDPYPRNVRGESTGDKDKLNVLNLPSDSVVIEPDNETEERWPSAKRGAGNGVFLEFSLAGPTPPTTPHEFFVKPAGEGGLAANSGVDWDHATTLSSAIAKAADADQPVTIYVKEGTYSEGSDSDIIASIGSSHTQPITILGGCTGVGTAQGTGYSLYQASSRNSPSQRPQWLKRSSDSTCDLTISRVKVKLYDQGAFVEGSGNFTMTDCHFIRNGDHGALCAKTTGQVTLQRCEFRGNLITGKLTSGADTTVWDDRYFAPVVIEANATIEHCAFVANVACSLYTWNCGGLGVGGTGTTVSIDFCTFAYNICAQIVDKIAQDSCCVAGLSLGGSASVSVDNSIFVNPERTDGEPDARFICGCADEAGDPLYTGHLTLGYVLIPSGVDEVGPTGKEWQKGIWKIAPNRVTWNSAKVTIGEAQLVDKTSFWKTGNPSLLGMDVDDNARFRVSCLDAETIDIHPLSAGGHYQAGEWVADYITSPAVDRGAPAVAYSNEPSPNGGRVNLGYYGNTAEASKTPSVTFDQKGGTGGAGPVSPTVGATMPTISGTPTLANHRFAGYSREGWEVVTMTGRDTDIYNIGTLTYAYCPTAVSGGIKLNGVKFESLLAASATAFGQIEVSATTRSSDGGSGSVGKSDDYKKLMNHKLLVENVDQITVTLKGLEKDHSYLMQLVCHEGVSGYKAGFNIDGVNYECNSKKATDIQYGRSFVLRFKATGSSYSFPLKKIDSNGFIHINAIQVRDITSLGSLQYYDGTGASVREYPVVDRPAKLYAQWVSHEFFVKPTGQGGAASNSGANWENATTLSSAIARAANASEPVTIYVHEGTYKEGAGSSEVIASIGSAHTQPITILGGCTGTTGTDKSRGTGHSVYQPTDASIVTTSRPIWLQRATGANCSLAISQVDVREYSTGAYVVGSGDFSLTNCNFIKNGDTGALYAKLTSGKVSMYGCEFRGNLISWDNWDSYYAPVVILSDATITHCAFVANGNTSGGINYVGGLGVGGSGTIFNIDFCTFAYNAAKQHQYDGKCYSGLVLGGSAAVTVRNSVFANVETGNSIMGRLANKGGFSGVLNLDYVLLPSMIVPGPNDNGYGSRIPTLNATHVVIGDANLVHKPSVTKGTAATVRPVVSEPTHYWVYSIDPESIDIHLKSVAGHWNGTDWMTDTVTSPAIDAGDPAADFANEPMPNGGCVNLGYYGNTAQASKSPYARVRLNANGGTPDPDPATVTVTAGQAMPHLVEAQTNITRSGYAFLGYGAKIWEARLMTGADTDICNEGTTVFARMAVSGGTLNSVTFDAGLSANDENVELVVPDGSGWGGPTSSYGAEGISNAYGDLLKSAVWNDSKDKSLGSMCSTITLKGLTPGRSYLFQFFVHDGRQSDHGHPGSREVSVDEENWYRAGRYGSGGTLDAPLSQWGSTFIYRFVATDSTESVRVFHKKNYSDCPCAHFNAMQLRDITATDSLKYYNADGTSARAYPLSGGPTELFAQWELVPTEITGVLLADYEAIYDGSAKTPQIAAVMTASGVLLTADDAALGWDVTYERERVATTDLVTEGQLQVVVTGKGKLSGSARANYRIVNPNKIALPKPTDVFKYTGAAITPTFTPKGGYTITANGYMPTAGTIGATAVGTYRVTCTLESGKAWANGSTAPYDVEWQIVDKTFLERLAADERIAGASPIATGGDLILKNGNTYIHVFTNTAAVASFTPGQNLNARVLLVGGGGAGGWGSAYYAGAGGGAGGMVEANSVDFAVGGAYQVQVGAGAVAPSSYGPSSNGLDSWIKLNETAVAGIAVGGGAGGNGDSGENKNGKAGGSGGGGVLRGANDKPYSVGGNGVAGQGYAGGAGNGGDWTQSAGGGGAGGNGGDESAGGFGGKGRLTDILGFEQYFAGGGGGGTDQGDFGNAGGIGGGGAGRPVRSEILVSGENGLGAGGGGGSGCWSGSGEKMNRNPGRGGDGIVIIAYEYVASGDSVAPVPESWNTVREVGWIGKTLIGVEAAPYGSTLSSNYYGDVEGTYTAIATLAPGYTQWSDGSTALSREINWKIVDTKTWYLVVTDDPDADGYTQSSFSKDMGHWNRDPNATVGVSHKATAGYHYVVLPDKTIALISQASEGDNKFAGRSLTLEGTMVLRYAAGEKYVKEWIVQDGMIRSAESGTYKLNGETFSIPDEQSLTFRYSVNGWPTDGSQTYDIMAQSIIGAGTVLIDAATAGKDSGLALSGDASGFTGAIAMKDGATEPQNFTLTIANAFGGTIESLPSAANVTEVRFNSGANADRGLVVSSTTIPEALKSKLVVYGYDVAAADKPLITFPAGTTVNAAEFTIRHASSVDAEGTAFKSVRKVTNSDGTISLYPNIEYTLSFEGLEGASNPNEGKTFTVDDELILIAPGQRDGYVFGGWQENGEPISYIRKGTMGNKTLTATWVDTNDYQLIEYIATTNCQFLDTGVTPRNAHFGFALDFWDQCYVNLEDQDTSRSWYNDRIALGSSDANGAGVWVCNWNLASFHGQVVLCHSLNGWDYLSMVSTDPCLRNDVRIRMKIVNDTEGEAYSKGGITPTDTTSYYIYTLDKVNDDLSTEQVTKSYKQIWYGGTDLYADRPEWFAGSVIVGGAHQVDGSGVTNVVRYTNDNPTTVNKNFMRFYRVTFYYDDIVLYDAIPAVDSNGHVGLLRVDGTEGELFAYSKTIQQDWLDAGNELGAEFATPHFIVNGNGGEPGETVVIKVLDEAAQPALTLAQLPTREEWTLTGFTANADGTGVKYFDADGTRLVTPADGAVVYAQWEQQRVILDDNGGAEGDGSVPLTDGVPEASSVTRPFYNGYSFRGYWTTKDDDTGTMIYDRTGALVANPPTLAPGSTIYAHWEFVVTYYLAGTDQPKDSLPKTYSFYCTPTNENGTLKSSKKGWAEAKGGESVRHIVEPGHKYVAEAFLNTPYVSDGSVQEFPGDELYLSSWLELYSDVRFKKLITGGLKTVFCVDANNCDVTVSGAVEMESNNTLELIVCGENRRLKLAAKLTGDENTVIKLLGQNQNYDNNLGYVISGDASGFKGKVRDGTNGGANNCYYCMFDVSFTGSFGGSVESFPTNVANAWFNYDGLPDTRTTRGLTMSCETPADVASVTNNIILYSDSPSVDFDASNFPLMTFPAGTAVDPAQFTVCHATEVGGEKTAFEDLYAIRNADETITLIANAQIVTLDDNGGAEGDGAVLLDNGVPPASVSRPFYNGWSFRGYWTTKDDDTGAMIYDRTGTRVAESPTLHNGDTIYAHWEFVEIYYLAGPDQGADPSFDGTPPGKEDTVNGWAEEPNGPAVRHTVEPGHKYTTKNDGKGYSLFTPSNQDGEVHSFLGDELTVAGTFALQESINVTNMIANGASIYTWKNGYHYIVDGQITVTNNSTLQLTGVGTDRTLEIRAKVKSGDGEIIALHGQPNANQRNLRFIISGDMSEFKGTWTKSSTEIAVPTTIDFSGSFGGRIKCFPTNMVNVLVNHDGLPASCKAATGLPVTAAASADDVRSVQTNVTFYSTEVDFTARFFPLMTFPASVAAEVDPAQFTVYHAADTNGTKTAFANLGVRKNGDGTITLVANSVLSAIRENGPEIHFWNLDWIAEVCPGEKTAAEYQAAFLKTNAQGVVTWQAYVLGYEPNEVATAAIVEETVQNANPDTVTVRLRDMPENPRTNDQVSVRYTLLSARTTSDFQAGLAKVVINLDDDPYELWPVSTFEAPLRDLTGDKPLNYYQIKARFFINRPIYDEEVDWLRIESQDDDDYIDTGIKITHDMRIETKVMLETSRQSYSRFGFDDSIVKGQSVVGDEHGFTRIMFSVAQDTACFGFQSSGNVTSAGFVSVDEVKNTELVIAGDYNRYTVNDTEYSTYGNHIPNDPDVGTMKLMAFGNGRFSTGEFAGKMWYFRLYKGDELIADFVPVKFTAGDGEVEYAMYDKVGGMLHRNHGTGSFTGGPAVQ